MTKHHDTGRLSASLNAITMAVAVAAVACCAAPLLIASGALAVFGGALRNEWVIVAATLGALAALAYTVHHGRARTRHGRPPDRCPHTRPYTTTGGHDDRSIA